MSKEKRSVPKLRFPGFTEDWEQRKLGDLYKRVNERNDGTLGRDKWISVAKMYFQEPDKVQSNNLDTRTYVMKKGDIAFEGHPNNEFKFGRFVLNDIGTGIISELFPIYRPITEYDLDFWKYAIQLERVMAPIFAKSITSSGNSSNKLDHNHFLNQELLVPNIEEQKKIGTLLSILSKNITLHQRKLEHLNLKKKALLQKLFPKNGERYPELRFPGFTDAWEQRKVNEIFKVTRGQVLAASLTTPEKNRENIYPVYSSQTKDNGLLGYYSEYLFENAITWTTDGANAGTVNFRPGRFYSTNVNGVLINENGYACYAVSEIINKVAYKYVSKVGNPKLMNNVMAEINIMITPDIDELEQISKLIEAYNQYITLHQRKLEHLQLQKKALLQQMFV